jgi:hypothetical protein
MGQSWIWFFEQFPLGHEQMVVRETINVKGEELIEDFQTRVPVHHSIPTRTVHFSSIQISAHPESISILIVDVLETGQWGD